jgi:hypothetical protein
MVHKLVVVQAAEVETELTIVGILIKGGRDNMKKIQKMNKKLDSKAAVDLSRNFARRYKKSKPKLPRILKTK